MFVVLYTIICCFSFRTSSLMTQKNYSPLHHCHIYIYSKLCLTYEVIDSVLKPQKVIILCIYLTVLGVYTIIPKKIDYYISTCCLYHGDNKNQSWPLQSRPLKPGQEEPGAGFPARLQTVCLFGANHQILTIFTSYASNI